MKTLIKCIALVLLAFATPCFAQPGYLDSTYGQGGYNVIESRSQGIAHSMLVLPDNKMLVAGVMFRNYVLFKCDTKGEIDPDFGIQEQGEMEDNKYYPLSVIALQSDGSIIVANRLNSKLAVYRYHTTGDIDNSFGNNGIAQSNDTFSVATSVAIQQDDKIVVAYRMGKIIRLMSNGSIDSSWGKNGVAAMPDTTIDIIKILVQPDQKIIAVGENTTTVRFNTDGSIDTFFGTSGTAPIAFDSLHISINTALLQPDGKILLAGSIAKGDYSSNYCDYLMIRLNADGRPDISFGKIGVSASKLYHAYFNKFYSLCLQHDGKIVVGGTTFDGRHYKMLLMRLFPDGNIDFSFGSGFGYTQVDVNRDQDDICAVAMQTDGKIVAAGSTLLPERRKNIVVARFDNDYATLVNNISLQRYAVYPNPANDVLNISIDNYSDVKYSISNSIGQILENGILRTKTIDISSLPENLYFLNLQIPHSDPVSLKFLKQ